MDNAILLKFVSVTIFSLMFAIGVNHSFEHLTTLWRRPQLLLRSLLAVIGLVPLVVVVLLWLFDLPPAVATGLAVLAAAPGAPLSLAGSPRSGRRSERVRSVEVEGQFSREAKTGCKKRLYFSGSTR
ncbi:MAG: hypothetical protein WCF40_13075 [Desulfobacterales bacterium]